MSNVAICLIRTYKLHLSYVVNAASLRTATCLLHTEDGINFFNPTLLSSQRTNCVKCRKIPHLCRATQESLRLEGTILLQVGLGDLRVRVWLGIVNNLAVDMLLGTYFIDCCIRRIFSAERNALL